MKDVRPRASWSEGLRIGANLRNRLKSAENQSFACCLFVGRARFCGVVSARRLWRVRLCPCSNCSFVRALHSEVERILQGAFSNVCTTHQRKGARFLQLTTAALERVVATGDHMLPAGAATGRFCALQSATLGSVARAQSVFAHDQLPLSDHRGHSRGHRSNEQSHRCCSSCKSWPSL